MKVSLEWLRDYVDLPPELSAEEIKHELTMATVEVESVLPVLPVTEYEGIVVARVVKVSPHPNSDNLTVATCDLGEKQTRTIVCGASNLNAEMNVAVATVGSHVWKGSQRIKIEPQSFEGVTSEGMICAPAEIGLARYFRRIGSREILDLTGFDVQAGDDLLTGLSLRDMVFEIDNKSLTHRPDLWGHYGIARELSAIFGAKLRPLPTFSLSPTIRVDRQISTVDECRRFMCVAIDNVHVEESPFHLRSRLERLDEQSHNLLVDLTNYVMLAVGQPSHAFDAAKVQGSLNVRFASDGEELLLLDGENAKLESDDLVVADSREAVALAGIKGGNATAISDATQNMLLEVANFDGSHVRRTSKRLGIRGEASARFEKSLDPELPAVAAGLFLDMLTTLQPQCKVKSFVDDYRRPPDIQPIEVTAEFLEWKLGRQSTDQEVHECLEKLGFDVSSVDSGYKIVPPSWRATGDISIPEDIVEEIARLHGYEELEAAPLTVHFSTAVNQESVRLERRLKEFLAYSAGMDEVMTYPWAQTRNLEAVRVDLEKCVSLHSPPAPDQRFLQPSLVPQLLSLVAENLRYFENFRLYEVSRVFQRHSADPSRPKEARIEQPKMLGGVVVAKSQRNADGAGSSSVFRMAKGILESLGRSLLLGEIQFGELQEGDRMGSWHQPQSALEVMLHGNSVGLLGIVSGKTKQAIGIKRADVACFEINLEKLLAEGAHLPKYQHPPELPSIEVDVSCTVPEEVQWKELQQVTMSAISLLDHEQVETIAYVDEYRGQQVPDGCKSITFRMTVGSDSVTLTQDRANEIRDQVVSHLAKTIGAKLRTL